MDDTSFLFPKEGVFCAFGAGGAFRAPARGTFSSAKKYPKRRRGHPGPHMGRQRQFLFSHKQGMAFAADCVCLRLLPRSPLTLSAGAVAGGRASSPSLLRQGSAQRSGKRGKRRRGTQITAKDDWSGGIGTDFPYLEKSALFFWTVHGPFSFRQDEKKMGGGIAALPCGQGNRPLSGGKSDSRPETRNVSAPGMPWQTKTGPAPERARPGSFCFTVPA